MQTKKILQHVFYSYLLLISGVKCLHRNDWFNGGGVY